MSANPTKVDDLYVSSLITKLNYFIFNIMLQMSFSCTWKTWENHIRKNPRGFRSCSPLFKQTKNCFLFLKYCIFWLCSAMTDKIYLNCSLKSCTILYVELLLERILHQLLELLKGANKRSMGTAECVGLKNYTYR